MEELTYEEHIAGKRKGILEQYTVQINISLRNIELNKDDIDHSGILTDTFFNRDDVSDIKKSILNAITKKAKEELAKYTI